MASAYVRCPQCRAVRLVVERTCPDCGARLPRLPSTLSVRGGSLEDSIRRGEVPPELFFGKPSPAEVPDPRPPVITSQTKLATYLDRSNRGGLLDQWKMEGLISAYRWVPSASSSSVILQVWFHGAEHEKALADPRLSRRRKPRKRG